MGKINLVLLLVVTLGTALSNALTDFMDPPPLGDGFDPALSPTCTKSCADYKAMGACTASWSGCNPAYPGKTIEFFCAKTCYVPPVDPCANVNCQNGGVCNNGVCTCPAGCSGTYCESCDPCKNVNCMNGGVCNNGKCICPAGCSGTYCESCDPCNPNPCQNGGTCNNGACTCPAGCSGTKCESCITGPSTDLLGTWQVSTNKNFWNCVPQTSNQLICNGDRATLTISGNKVTFENLISGQKVVGTNKGNGIIAFNNWNWIKQKSCSQSMPSDCNYDGGCPMLGYRAGTQGTCEKTFAQMGCGSSSVKVKNLCKQSCGNC